MFLGWTSSNGATVSFPPQDPTHEAPREAYKYPIHTVTFTLSPLLTTSSSTSRQHRPTDLAPTNSSPESFIRRCSEARINPSCKNLIGK
jgi:hypothetical protein